MTWLTLDVNEAAVMLAVAFVTYILGRRAGSAARDALLKKAQSHASRLESSARETRRALEDMRERAARLEKSGQRLQCSLAELPEIAQRLSASRSVREIPERALDLVQELFDPTYSVLYKTRGDELVAAACRGASEYGPGHRVRVGEGVVGWAAVKQLPLTMEDVESESRMVRETNLSTGIPEQGLTLCLPIVRDSATIAVLLIGPSERDFGNPRAVGRTIALLTAMALTSAAELKQQTQRAETDGLTGLLNKTNVVFRIDQILDAENDVARTVSVFLMDIDHFKNYNDTNGHPAGDDLLREVSALLTNTVRDGELVGRYGGEEFLVVFPDTDRNTALQAAERIRNLIASQPLRFGDRQPLGMISVSGGVANFPLDATDTASLIQHADEALYAAKHAGRNTVLAYAPLELTEADDEDLDLDEVKLIEVVD
jgi:diguanylate cyclase (GGDEF)-like protein